MSLEAVSEEALWAGQKRARGSYRLSRESFSRGKSLEKRQYVKNKLIFE